MDPNGRDAQTRRVSNRKKRRTPCLLTVGHRVHTGLVLDLSLSGLFIQTNAKTYRGERIEMELSVREDHPLDMVVEVVRTKSVPPRLLTVAQGGIGVRIISAPEEYYEFLNGIGVAERQVSPREDGGAGATAALDGGVELESDPGPHFRVRVGQLSGPRTRRVEVAAPDADAAAALALQELGDGWKVLGVDPV
jgi:PilZ domain